MQQRIEALERRLATLETAYMELLAALAPLGGNQPTGRAMARRYEQNLQNLLPDRSHRRRREMGNDSEAPAATEPPGTRQRLQ